MIVSINIIILKFVSEVIKLLIGLRWFFYEILINDYYVHQWLFNIIFVDLQITQFFNLKN